MSLYLVDTSVWIFALRRTPVPAIVEILGELLRQDMVAICPLIELELLGGAANPAEFSRLQNRLLGLHRLEIGHDDWESAARLAFDLRRRGVTVPLTDVLLAALALRVDATLLNVDHDFDNIAKHCPLRAEGLANLLATADRGPS